MDKMKLIDVDEARVLWELGVDVYIKERDRSYSRLPSGETPAPGDYHEDASLRWYVKEGSEDG